MLIVYAKGFYWSGMSSLCEAFIEVGKSEYQGKASTDNSEFIIYSFFVFTFYFSLILF